MAQLWGGGGTIPKTLYKPAGYSGTTGALKYSGLPTRTSTPIDNLVEAVKQQQSTVAPTPVTTPATSYSGGGVSYEPYQFPKINLPIPDFSWKPTEEEKANRLTEAVQRASLKIDPQREAIRRALENFGTAAETQRAEINPRYTRQNLAIANIIQNSVKQELVDNAIRRGATESGWLPEQLAAAGRYEVEQRGQVENERNTLLNEIARQLLGKETETSEREIELEKLRGLEEATGVSELERQARSDFMQETNLGWNANLSKAQLINSQAAAEANASYNDALIRAQLEKQSWDRQQAEKEYALNATWQNYKMRPTSANAPQLFAIDTPYGKMNMSIEQMIKAGFFGSGDTGTGFGF